MNLIIFAIPVFFLLIGVELIVSKTRKLSYYRFNDAITNLSCGIGSTVTAIFLKTLTVVAYVKIYEVSLFRGIPNTWWVGILLFLGVDFCYYWFHRLAHEVSIMWGSHAVHHQSEEYNLSVALRQAWYQGAFSFVFYLPLAVLGFNPTMFLIISQLVTLYQFWIHTRLINKLPAPIEYIFNTPSHHRVHHGVNPQYIDKNHAGTLIIWDRMFGTFEPEEEEVVYGITKQAKSWNPVWLNFEYWGSLASDLRKAGTMRDRYFMLTNGPGWLPEELGGVPQFKKVSPETFNKYDTEISSGLNYYVLFQFIVVLIGATAFLIFSGSDLFKDSTALKLLATALIIFSLLNIGGMFEKRSWVPVAEFMRIIALGAVVFILFKDTPMLVLAGSITAVIAFISLAWFSRYLREFKVNTFNNVQANAH